MSVIHFFIIIPTYPAIITLSRGNPPLYWHGMFYLPPITVKNYAPSVQLPRHPNAYSSSRQRGASPSHKETSPHLGRSLPVGDLASGHDFSVRVHCTLTGKSFEVRSEAVELYQIVIESSLF